MVVYVHLYREDMEGQIHCFNCNERIPAAGDDDPRNYYFRCTWIRVGMSEPMEPRYRTYGQRRCFDFCDVHLYWYERDGGTYVALCMDCLGQFCEYGIENVPGLRTPHELLQWLNQWPTEALVHFLSAVLHILRAREATV